MFRPERMSLVEIVFLKEHISRVGAEMLRLAALHVENARRFSSGALALQQVQTGDERARLAELRTRLEAVARSLGVYLEIRPDVEPEIFAGDAAEQIDARFRRIERDTKRLDEQIASSEQAIGERECVAMELEALEHFGLNVDMLTKSRFFLFRVGSIPQENVEAARHAVESMGGTLQVHAPMGDIVFVCIGAPAEAKDELENLLRATNFQYTPIPSHYPETSSEAADIAELETWQDRETIANARAEKQRLAEQHRDDLNRIYTILCANEAFLDAKGRFLQTKEGYYVASWVPTRDAERVKNRLTEECKGQVDITITPAEVFEPSEESAEPVVPTKFNHPRFLRPFQMLVKLYGFPTYKNIDPTAFTAFSFTFMFGMMFGDVGHGAVLVALGLLPWLLRFPASPTTDLAWILFYCGCSSIFFGFCFGSVFGNEDIIQPLFLSPLEDPLPLMAVGVLVGVFMISFGIILSIIQFISRRNFAEAILNQWGLVSMVVYWLCIMMVVDAVRTGETPIGVWPFVIILGLLLSFLTFGDIIIQKWTGHGHVETAEAVFKPIELMLGLLTNTVSYVRVAAFAMNHAALMGAAALIADITSGGSVFMRNGSLVMSNITVILFEGLIVFIQCMRLQYYEFYSKFFVKQGREFLPLTLSNPR